MPGISYCSDFEKWDFQLLDSDDQDINQKAYVHDGRLVAGIPLPDLIL